MASGRKVWLFPRDAQRAVQVKRSGSGAFSVAFMASALKRNFYHIACKHTM